MPARLARHDRLSPQTSIVTAFRISRSAGPDVPRSAFSFITVWKTATKDSASSHFVKSSSFGGPFDLAVGDLNRDGKPDIAVANADSNAVTLLFG